MTPEETTAMHELMLSPTMGRIATLAKGFPLDPTDKDDIRTAMTTASMDMIRALDAERIHFDQDEDRAMLFGLLVTVMEVIFEGRFASHVVESAPMQ